MIKSKSCSVESCNSPRFSMGYCKAHQSLRADSKKPKPLKRGGNIKKISEKGLEKKKIKTENTKIIHQAMYNFWFKSDKKCWECNKSLAEFATYMVDHLLAKSKHPELALEEENFFLCCLECHSSKEMGFPKPKHKQALEEAKNKFKI